MDPDDASIAARMRSLARLARPTAHELRGALSAIHLHLELLATALDGADDQSTTERRRRYLGVLNDECKRLQRVADAFLDLVAPSSRTSMTDVSSLVAGVVNAARPLAIERRLHLECEQGPPLAGTLSDPEACRQRLLDAVLDVVDSAHGGSTVRVDLVPGGRHATVAVDGSTSADIPLLACEEPKRDA